MHCLWTASQGCHAITCNTFRDNLSGPQCSCRTDAVTPVDQCTVLWWILDRSKVGILCLKEETPDLTNCACLTPPPHHTHQQFVGGMSAPATCPFQVISWVCCVHACFVDLLQVGKFLRVQCTLMPTASGSYVRKIAAWEQGGCSPCSLFSHHNARGMNDLTRFGGVEI